MNKILISFCLISWIIISNAQQPNWGWGLPVSVTQNGSNITLSVFDPDLNQDRTKTVTADQYINNQGVVLALDQGSKVTYNVYDINKHAWEEELSYVGSSSNVELLNVDGVIAFAETGTSLSGGYKVQYAVYDPIRKSWQESFAYISDNCDVLLTNADGVVAFAETNTSSNTAVVHYATYDAVSGQWKESFDYIAGDEDVVLTNADGVVAFSLTGQSLSGTYKVQYAVYDLGSKQWKEGFDYVAHESEVQLVNSHGVVAYAETGTSFNASYEVGYAVYDFSSNQWRESASSISRDKQVTGLSIINGSVQYNYDGSSYKKGFSSGQWSNNSNTSLTCKLFVSDDSGNTLPFITHFSCLSIGANNYSYNAGDGHSITRRWGWKQYDAPGNYNVQLTISNSTSNSTCSDNINVTGSVGIENKDDLSAVMVYPNPANDKLIIETNSNLDKVEISLVDMLGQTVLSNNYSAKDRVEFNIDAVSGGLYMLRVSNAEVDIIQKVCIRH